LSLETTPIISLFSGAGGLDLGIEDAGGQIRVCVEPDPVCAETLRINRRYFPSAAIIHRPLEEVLAAEILAEAGLRKGEATLVVGGPPCQPFSKAAYWLMQKRKGLNDSRVGLLEEFVRVLRETKPDGFIFENVASLFHPGNRGALSVILDGASAAGYATSTGVLHAVDYGVPQTRSRLFAIGLRGRTRPTFPEPTHLWAPHGNGSSKKMKLPAETAWRWIAAFDHEDLFEPQEVVAGKWENQLRAIPPGWNYKWLTAWAGHESPSFVEETKYWSFLLKLSPTRPSWTLPASPGPWVGPFHWNNRRLRLPERAALQTFPAAYRFAGNRNQVMRQIGNAVPCLLASKIAAHLLSQILGVPCRRGRKLRYSLSNDPPPASVFSPTHRGVRW
jgi:DNA (cytosine-5)-methyltransferase 1